MVREANGALVRVVDPITSHDSDSFLDIDGRPALSPDGSGLVFSRVHLTDTGITFALRRVDLGTGAVSVISGGADHVAWSYLTASTLISVDGASSSTPSIVTLPVAGGAATPVAGLDAERTASSR